MWQEKNNQLVRNFEFKDFKKAISFINKVAELAESANHHPWLSNEYNKVTIKLCTHDEGDVVTSKDHKLAEEIDRID